MQQSQQECPNRESHLRRLENFEPAPCVDLFVITFHFGSLYLGTLNPKPFGVVKMRKTTLFIDDDRLCIDIIHNMLSFCKCR